MQQLVETQKPTALTPADPLGARFCEYFSNPWRHIYAPVPEPGEKPAWKTAHYFLDPRTLWRRHQDPDILIGLAFGEETRYAVLDIDRGSPYHPANDPNKFKEILAALEEIGLCRREVVQSSSSGGLHVFLFFEKLQPTFKLACRIQLALEDAGFRLQSGWLEIFPNTKAWGSYYKACRLPLQDGSYSLDDDLQPYTNDIGLFLDAADLCAAHQDLTTLEAGYAEAEKRYKSRKRIKTSKDHTQWVRDWEETIAEGWTGHGQTNDLLQVIVGYGMVWEGLLGSELEDWAVATAVAAPGYQQWCRHQHEIRERVRHRIRSSEVNEYYSKYCSYPNRRGNYKKLFEDATNNVVPFRNPVNSRINEERSATATDRIKQIVSTLEGAGELPKAVVTRIKTIIAKGKELFNTTISNRTFWKHLSLWHPKHYKPESILQEKALLLGDSSEIPTPPFCSTGFIPQPESLEPLTLGDSSENSHTPPLMKVLGGGVSGTAAPQGQAVSGTTPENMGGESEGGDLPQVGGQAAAASGQGMPLLRLIQIRTYMGIVKALSGQVAAVDQDTPTASEVSQVVPAAPTAPAGQELEVGADTPETLEIRRLTRIRLELNRKAQKQVSSEAFGIGGKKRRHLEEKVKNQLYWESGEPALMVEATEWAIANPDALPEALPPTAPEESPPILLEDYSQFLGGTPNPADFENPYEDVPPPTDTITQDVAEEPLKVNDRVWWDNCPGHCSWANPFTVTAIEGDTAWLDLYSKPVPLSELRRCARDS